MKTLVWPDVHHRTELLKIFLDKNGDQFDKRIFLGDWFDNWNDNPADAARTARLLVELIDDDRNVFIEGNHDTAYRYGTPVSLCSGFTNEKKRFVDSVMKFHHWQKFKLYEMEQGWLCSHAGVHPCIFSHPIHGVKFEWIESLCVLAQDQVRANIWNPVYDLGKMYDGQMQTGGITWLRWSQFEPIENLNQIVGHSVRNTPEVSYIRKKTSKYEGEEKEKHEKVKCDLLHFMAYPPKIDKLCSLNYNIDTDNKYFAIIEDGEVNIHFTLDFL